MQTFFFSQHPVGTVLEKITFDESYLENFVIEKDILGGKTELKKYGFLSLVFF